MNKVFLLFFLFSLNAWSQISLPIQQSVLPKNSLVVNYDFSKSTSYTGASSTVTNIASNLSGNATLLNNPIYFNSLGLISFDGTNQYLVTPNLRSHFKAVNSSVQNSFTMSFWVYPTASTGILVYELDSQTPNYAWNASNIELANGYVKYRVWNGSAAGPLVTSSTTVNLNQWYHIAMVYDGTSIKGYLNGVLQGSQILTRIIPINGQFYAIGAGGAQNMGTSAYGKFTLAQFKINNLPFSDKDVSQEYESRKSEFDYTIHSPSTNSLPTYWNVSSAWNNSSGSVGAPDAFGVYHFTPWLNSGLGWAAQTLDANQWITLSYDEPAYIKGVVIQGRANNGGQWVTKAHVETSSTGTAPWTRVLTDANVNNNSLDDVRLNFTSSVYAKSVKVIPVTWSSHITLRLGMLVKPNNYVTDGLVLRLDAANLKSYASGTTWTDLSGNGNHVTLVNGPTFDAAAGGQIVMDGVNDYANTSTALSSTSGNNSRTVMVWYKSTVNRNTILIDKGSVLDDGAEQLFIAFTNSVGTSGAYPPTNPGGIVLTFWGNDLYYPIASSTLFDGNWHFVAYTYDNSNSSVKICYDGTFATSVYQWNTSWTTNNSSPFLLPNAINTATNPLWIGQTRGALWGNGGNFANASIPYVYIYNRVLSESEILGNFNATRTRYGR